MLRIGANFTENLVYIAENCAQKFDLRHSLQKCKGKRYLLISRIFNTDFYDLSLLKPLSQYSVLPSQHSATPRAENHGNTSLRKWFLRTEIIKVLLKILETKRTTIPLHFWSECLRSNFCAQFSAK